MKLQKLKGKTVEGYALDITPEEALEIIRSLSGQLQHHHWKRNEWNAEGAGYFSIFVIHPGPKEG